MKSFFLKIFQNKISKIFFIFTLLFLGFCLFNATSKVSATTDCPNPSSGCYCYPRHVSVTYNSCSNGKITSATFKWDGSNCGFYVFNFYGSSSSGNQIGSVNLGHAAGSSESHTLSGISASANLGVGTKDPLKSNPEITFDTSPTNNCPPPITDTPTPTITPAATHTPTPSPTPSGPTATPTITPTPTPIFTTGDVTVHFEGIDKDNFPAPGGQDHSSRHIVLFLYKPAQDGTVDFSKNATYTLPPSTVQLQSTDTNKPDYGFFRNKSFPMKGVPTGDYYILVKAKEGSLVEEIGDSAIPITGGAKNVIVNIDGNSDNQDLPTDPPLLRMGDIITDCTGTSTASCSYNYINALDYSALKDCFGANITSADCLAHNLSAGHDYNIANLNDHDGVDGVDYTILLKHFENHGVGDITQNGGKDH
jgi:hypothetical protein